MQYDLSLFDLIAPYILRGGTFIDAALDFGQLHAAVSVVRVQSYETILADDGVVIRGRARIGGDLDVTPPFFDPMTGTFRFPGVSSGNTEGYPRTDPVRTAPFIEFEDTEIEFSLTAPRLGSALMANAVTGVGGQLAAVMTAIDATPADGLISDAPGAAFTLDLLFKGPTIRVPGLRGACLDTEGVLTPDPINTAVRFRLPKLKIQLRQGPEQNGQAPLIAQLLSLGATGLDDPGDLAVAELVTMDPPYAFIGPTDTVGFGFRTAVLDLSDGSTPPDVLTQFGYDESWTGLYLPEVRLFVSAPGMDDYAVTGAVNNLLLGIGPNGGGVTFDAMLMLIDTGNAEIELGARFVDDQGRAYGIDRGGSATSGPARTAVASIAQRAMMVVDLRGGRPPYTVTIAVDGGAATPAKHVHLDLTGVAQRTVVISATDSRPGAQTQTLTITVRLTTPKYRAVTGPEQAITVVDPVTITQQSARRGSMAAPDITFSIIGESTENVTVMLNPADAATNWRIPGQQDRVGLSAPVPVGPGASANFTARRPAKDNLAPVPIFFRFDQPQDGTSPGYGLNEDNTHTAPARSSTDGSWSGGDAAMAVLQPYLVEGASISVVGHASFDGKTGAMGSTTYEVYNQRLSLRRAESLKALIESKAPGVQVSATGLGFAGAPQEMADSSRRQWWRADVSIAQVTEGEIVAQGVVARPVHQEGGQVSYELVRDPPPKDPEPPRWLRSLGGKIRFVRGELVAFELFGKFDLQTKLEEQMAVGARPPKLRRLDGNPADGLIDFRGILQVDTTTKTVITQVTIGADPADTDGLRMTGTLPGEPLDARDLSRNLLGAVTMFAPVLSSAARPLPDGAPSDLILTGAVAALTGLAAIEAINFERVILYGGESLTHVREGQLETSLLFDVETAMSLTIPATGPMLVSIDRANPLVARYKALGVRLRGGAGARWSFRPIFDSSRGYTIDITRPGALTIADPLGSILKVLAARIARTNPLSFEIDLGLSIDLGFVSVDRIGVRQPLDPLGPPEITAMGATVDIPGAFKGKGFLALSRDGEKSSMAGGLDLTLVPLRLRLSGQIKIDNFMTPEGSKTGVLVTIEVNFPVGIPLGNSGLGIFGFLGLLGVNFTRTEEPYAADPTPALAWLKATGGNPTDVRYWHGEAGRWAFGVGAVVGTMEGGFLLNLKGMVILELPGPRLLLMMKANLLIPKLPVKGTGEGLLLAVIDLDLGRGTMTIGVVAEFSVAPLLEIRIPTEAFFNFKDISDWHVYLGRYSDRIQASVLEIFDGSAYLMVSGKALPPGEIAPEIPMAGALVPQGMTVVTGVHASLVWGSVSAGLYARVAAGADALLGFEPFMLAGHIYMRGDLRLFVVSIEAYAALKVTIGKIDEDGNPETASQNIARIEGEICGKVELLFFDVEGCVDFAVGSLPGDGPAPLLLRGLSLVNRTAGRLAGTAADEPIDAILAEASLSAETAPVVPIDAIPVLLMSARPEIAAGRKLFFDKIATGPIGPPTDGYVTRGDKRYRYELESVELIGALTDGDTPAVWWKRVPTGTDPVTAELALLSSTPEPTPVAIERNELLDRRVEQLWGTTCDKAARPAAVLWHFNDVPPGKSPLGWRLRGEAWPDEAGTYRGAPPHLDIDVDEVWRCGNAWADSQRGIVAAEVEGYATPCERERGGIVVTGRRPRGSSVIRGVDRCARSATGRMSFTDILERIDSGQPVTRADLLASVVSSHSAVRPPEPGIHTCDARALAAPVLDEGQVIALGDAKDEGLVKEAWEKVGFRPYDLHDAIVIDTGAFEIMRLLLFVKMPALKTGSLLVRSVMQDGSTYDERVAVEAVEMPGNWQAGDSPWRHDVDHSLSFMTHLSREMYAPAVVEIKGGNEASRIIIGLDPKNPMSGDSGIRRPFYLSVVEGVLASEIERHSYDRTTLEEQRSVVTSAIGADSAARALLLPDTLYEVKVKGRIQQQGGGDTPIDASYYFRTLPGSEAPKRLDPYLICSLPGEGEKHVFGGEKIKLAFAHNNVQRLFATYGKRLQVRFKAASFRQPEVPPGVGHPFLLLPDTFETVGAISPGATTVLSPFDATLARLIAGDMVGRKPMDCVPGDGYRSEHSVVTVPIPLDPFTDYVMDVELVDAGAAADARGPFILRRSFSTGRYGKVADFADAILATRPDQTFVKAGRIAAMVSGFGGQQPEGRQFEDALAAAELPRQGPTDRPRITIFWEQSGSAPAVPAGILIEAPEPMTRFWDLPKEVVDPEPDPITRIVLEPRKWLEVTANAGTEGLLTGVVSDQDGRRVMASLAPGAQGKRVGLSLHRIVQPESYLDGADAPDQRWTIFDVVLDRAPWEED